MQENITDEDVNGVAGALYTDGDLTVSFLYHPFHIHINSRIVLVHTLNVCFEHGIASGSPKKGMGRNRRSDWEAPFTDLQR